eukprot:tig00001343_g8337.t1
MPAPWSTQSRGKTSAPEGAGPASSNTGVRGSGPAPAPGREAGGVHERAEWAEEALEEGFEEEEAGRGEEPFERDWGGAGAEGAEGWALGAAGEAPREPAFPVLAAGPGPSPWPLSPAPPSPRPPARPGPARSFSAHAGASWRPAPGRGPRGAGGGPEWPPLESPRRGHSAPKLSPQRFLRSS